MVREMVSIGLYLVQQFEKSKEKQGIQKHKHKRCVEHTLGQMEASMYKVRFCIHIVRVTKDLHPNMQSLRSKFLDHSISSA